MAMNKRGRSLRPELDWAYLLPPFLRHFLARCFVSWGHFRLLLVYLCIDVIALAFVRRGSSGAVVIIKHDVLGDYVLFRNFLQAVRLEPAFQGRRLVFCGNGAMRDLAETLDRALIDEFIWVDYPKGELRPLRRFKLLRRLKKLGAEIALHPAFWRNLLEADALVRATGAPVRIGWELPPSYPSWSEKTGWIDWNPPIFKWLGDRCYTRLLPYPTRYIFEFKRNQLFFQSVLTNPVLPEKPTLSAPPVELPPLPTRYAVLMPGAGHAVREWPAENYGRLARHLFDRYGLSIVVTGGARDAEKARRIGSAAGLTPVDLTGRLSLPQLAGVVARAEVVLANDSGGIHLAAALGIKAVGMSMGFSLIDFHPYPPEMEPTVRFVYPPAIREAPSHEAFLAALPPGDRLNIEDVSVESVVEAVDELLQGRGEFSAARKS
jgi:ADP-heptose:LPS heptosyltransferase